MVTLQFTYELIRGNYRDGDPYLYSLVHCDLVKCPLGVWAIWTEHGWME